MAGQDICLLYTKPDRLLFIHTSIMTDTTDIFANQKPNVFTPPPKQKGLVTNESWDSLNQFQEVLGGMLVDIGRELADAIRLLVRANIDTGEIRVTINGIQKDMESAFGKLIGLRQRHINKTGVIKTVDDYSAYMALGLDYNQLNENIQVQLWTPLTVVTEYVNQAHYKLNATNPDVVTDVTVKQVQEQETVAAA